MKVKKFLYTTTFINLSSFILTILVFLFINFCYSNSDKLLKKSSLKAGFIVNEVVTSNITNDLNSNIQETHKNENYNWYIEIPAISLKAEIAEGTTKEVMDNYVGHFEETEKWIGNVGLAAHNRGYKNNYFSDLKKLKEGDIINYYYNNTIRKYVVEKQIIIKDTDWTYLENTQENKLTLITCVENEPKYRRCVQAIEDKNI